MSNISKVNGVNIWWEEFGNRENPTILLIMGAYANCKAWPQDFIDKLVDENYHLIRFDNRDSGKSTWFGKRSPYENYLKFIPSILLKPIISFFVFFFSKKITDRKKVKSPYDLNDLTKDAVSLLEELKINKAHIVGASMGGLIAQIIGIKYPEKVKSLCLLITTPGRNEESLSPPNTKFLNGMTESALMMIKGKQKEALVKTFTSSIGSKYEYAKEDILKNMKSFIEHGYNPYAYHSNAINKSKSHSEELINISCPTLIINGSEDPLLPIDHGKALNKLIPQSELFIMDGVGHEIPEDLIPEITEKMVKNFEKS